MNNRLVLFVQIECFLFGLIECVARYPNQCDLWRRKGTYKKKEPERKNEEVKMLLAQPICTCNGDRTRKFSKLLRDIFCGGSL